MKIKILALFPALLGILVAEPHWAAAPTPPMGWNSWDYFGTTLNEDQALEQAAAMAKHLRPAGYDVFTVDIQWYEPSAKGHIYREGAPLSMDTYSRLQPAVEKFPSAANGAGFKPLADQVHGLGLRFGIHIMRGIPRQAVARNSAILGSEARASDIALPNHVCAWNPDMYGVDLSKEGAQAYYDSLFKLYAEWGVDFVKVDDIARPYDAVQLAEIEAIRRAIDKTGRSIVLSLSPGDTPLSRGEHVLAHANMWRISDDFWDLWHPLHEMFGRLDKWTQFRREGAWPDADMLPFGKVEFGRDTRFTPAEQQLCMTLWSIARSPLIFGGDMTKLDPFTLQLLTNPEVLAVNQHSTHNRQISRENELVVWTADVPGSRDRYVAFFNAQGKAFPFDLVQAVKRTGVLKGDATARVSVPLGQAKQLVLVMADGGDGTGWDHGAWAEPVLRGPSGVLDLTTLEWKEASTGWGTVAMNKAVDGQELRRNGKTIRGIGAHAWSAIVFDLPSGYDAFEADVFLTEGGRDKGAMDFAVLLDPVKDTPPSNQDIALDLEAVGIDGAVQVRDLWAREDLGVFRGRFTRSVPLHGAGLYRLTPVVD